MDRLNHLISRDPTDFTDDVSYGPSMGSLVYVFFTLLLLAGILSLALLCLRRKRLAREQATLPLYNRSSHHRTASVINFPNQGRNDAVFVYDEKMNLIANSSSPPSSGVPEIHITFPDEEDNGGANKKGRVVVVHVTETGSVGMSPLQQETLPPYQRSDAERFQSLDLERIGGLREKPTPPQRWS